jgi:uncharacterized membrane protein YphA (DoxX/SURF4 family)
MKLLVPRLSDAWSGQLQAVALPLYSITLWLVPILEILLGILLLLGASTRIAASIVIVIMMVATYVHIVVDDPALFPLQPNEPIIPLIVIALCAYLLWRGGGAWSLDLRITRGVEK